MSSSRRRVGVHQVVTVVLIVLAAGCSVKKPAATPEPSRFLKDIQSVRFDRRTSEVSFTSEENKIEVIYMDLGKDVGLVLRSPDNVLVYVDVNQDGRPTANLDKVYGVDLGTGGVCVPFLDSDPSQCQAARSEARAAVAQSNGRFEISLRIPKQELGPSQTEAHVVFEAFDVLRSEPSRRFPNADLFQKVYRLMYAPQDASQNVPELWPAAGTAPIPSAPPPIVKRPNLSAVPTKVFVGEPARLSYDVCPADDVTLNPGFGKVDCKGDRLITPEKRETYTLTYKKPEGQKEDSVTVEVKDVEIVNFFVSPRRVRQESTFILEWHVRGATEVGIETVGWPQGAQMNLPDSVRAAQSRLTLRASKKEFSTTGVYKFRLKANGPGGPKFAQADLEVLIP